MRRLAAALFLVLFAEVASASSIRGRIVHPNGYPAAGIAVYVWRQDIGASVIVYTGGDGMWYLNVPAGSYSVRVQFNNQWWSYGPFWVAEPATDIPPIGIPG